jgi:DHA1 family bicyclomycin/chloramphenicol resistance-like MFS transporter
MTAAGPSRALFPVLCLVAASGQIGSFLYLPALPRIAAEFDTDEAGVQATVAAFLVGSLFGFAVCGPLSDCFGRARTLLAAAALFVAGAAACALADGLAALTVGRMVQGFGSVAGVITARAVVRDAFPPDRAARAISTLSAVGAISPAIGPVAGALVLSALDWRAGFWLSAGLGAAAGLAGAAVLPRAEARRRAAGGTLGGIGRLFGSPVWRSCAAINASTNAAFMVMMAGSPFVFVEVLGMTPLGYSLLIGAILLGFAAVALRTGPSILRRGAFRTIRRALPLVTLGATAVAVTAALVPSVWTLGLALALMIAAMGIIVPSGHLALMAPFPDQAATATGISMLLATLAGAGAVLGYAAVAAGSLAGFGLAIAAMAGCVILVGLTLPASGDAA